MKPPSNALFSAPRTTAQPAAGRRGIQAAHRVAANVLSQCDRCGGTDDAEHRIGRERHDGCGGTFRLYGHAEAQ